MDEKTDNTMSGSNVSSWCVRFENYTKMVISFFFVTTGTSNFVHRIFSSKNANAYFTVNKRETVITTTLLIAHKSEPLT